MKPETMPRERTALRGWIDTVHGIGSGKPLTKKDFLQASWHAIASLVHHNKGNPLIQAAVREYPDLIPRSFAILSVLYGTYACEPSKTSMLKDFVAMLGEDLVEEELKVSLYAKQVSKGSFFPELSRALEMIHKIYSAEDFKLDVLPATPYRAYVPYVLSHPELLGKDVRLEELFGHLSVSESMMKKILTLVKPTGGHRPKEGPRR